MKRTISMIAIAITITTGVFAQKMSSEKVPVAVKAAFTREYAEATGVKWDKEKSDYEASFKMKGEDLSVLFSSEGKVIETEKGIAITELPTSVQTALKGKKIKEAAIITKNGKTYYEAEVGGKDHLFDAQGKAVEKL